MRITMWISTANDAPDVDAEAWQPAGEIDPQPAGDVVRVVQGYLGNRAPYRARSFGFYGNFDPTSAGYRALFGAEGSRDGVTFWLQLRIAGPPVEHRLTSNEPVEIAPVALHPHQPHPGLLTPVDVLGVQLSASSAAGLFTLD